MTTKYDRYRIESRPEWKPLVPKVEQASVAVLSACLQILRTHAIEVLSESRWDGLAALRPTIAQGAAGRDRIKAEAEAADERDLVAAAEDDALPEIDDTANVRAHVLFVIARALSALVDAAEASSDAAPLASAVLEGAYELSVTSPERNDKLLRELDSAMMATR
jgi:hypothetical protein